jgi:hypothetical protein
MIIYKNKNLIISFENNKYLFEIKDYANYKMVINTFLKNNFEVNNENIVVTVFAEEINTLEYFLKKDMSIENFKLIFLFLMKQLKELENNHLTILNYNLKDVIYFKINGEYSFYFLNEKNIFSFDKNQKIMINKLFIKNNFSSPEIYNVNEIPNNDITISNAYWSLAKMIEYCLKKNGRNLEDIKYTKLYWSLKRCLKKKSGHRYLIFI